ncbi:TadE/TadG family type IV pilus assembly protein [Novosphingobium sp. ERW19]|uniref:TadE/TadG family type IV pilus assembly protein n=1 Tax=Novosphingobium sp. ERW19 TaxID=2726186 RepID=UPI00180B4096|nr:TadE/TadG family type IV pilus assembly protein [Novosphingobium sp. ERW19]NLR38582.1 pilus assembly protein [Novosphingobium sp. ERW19]
MIHLCKRLARHKGGNATLLLALGMPAFIGGAGFAVDTAQWYMWKRELQFAVDQAALAGAWARTQSATRAIYSDRALQEFNANISTVSDITVGTPSVTLSSYAGGSNNSVTVSATVRDTLPFSSFLTGKGTTVTASAQAAYTAGTSFTSCLLALDEDDSGAVTIGGTSVLKAKCGIAALSTSESSILVDGNPDIDAGWVLSRGGIDEWFSTHTDDEVHDYLEGLFDPYANLSPPNPAESQVARNYYCVQGTTTTRADRNKKTTVTYTYWKGATWQTATEQVSNNKNAKKDYSTENNDSYVIVENTVVAGTTYTTTVVWTQTNNGSGNNIVWEKMETVVATTLSNISKTTTADLASVLPGTYAGGIKVSCATAFAPGVYVIDGGGVEISGQYAVVGSGVMFVLKNGAYIKINGGSNINLTAIQASELVSRGVSETNANALAGMLVFEDRTSTGTDRSKINGDSSTVLNGTIYLPNSGIDFTGTARVTSQCLMIAADTITISGTANMSSFCPPGVTEDTVVAKEVSKVKLIV